MQRRAVSRADAEELAIAGAHKHHWLAAPRCDIDMIARAQASAETAQRQPGLSASRRGLTAVPNVTAEATLLGVHPGDVRALLSYDYLVGRLASAAAWAGPSRAPKDFLPLHLEARALYGLKKNHSTSLPPYLGLTRSSLRWMPRERLDYRLHFDWSRRVRIARPRPPPRWSDISPQGRCRGETPV